MPLIAFDLSAGTAKFVEDIEHALGALDRFTQAAERTQKADDAMSFKGPGRSSGDSGGASSSMEAMGSSAAETAGGIRAAFASAMAPVGQLALVMANQFNQVGGTITTLARRIDSSMKFPTLMKAFDALEKKAENTFAQWPLQVARSAAKIHHIVSSMGDVAGRSLSSMFRFNLTGSIGQVTRLNVAFRGTMTIVNRLKMSVVALGAEMAAAFGVFMLGFKAVQFLKSSTVEASNLNETVNKTGLIFGQASGLVTRSADDMATRFGVLKSAFMDTADQFGQLLQGMGKQSKAASAQTSVQLTRLAADASSLFNVSFSEASQLMASAIRGQSEPISRFGVDVTESAVKLEALRMGILKVGQEMSTQQKVAARTSLVIRGLAVAQGDLARTGDQPANAARRFAGAMKNAGAQLMSSFLPVVQKGLGLLNDFATWLNNAFVRNKPAIDAFAARVATGLETVGKYLRNLPVVWEVVRLKLQEGVANLKAVFDAIPVNLQIVADWVANNWPKLMFRGLKAVYDFFVTLPGTIVKLGASVGAEIAPFFEGLGDTLADMLTGGVTGAFTTAGAKAAEAFKGSFWGGLKTLALGGGVASAISAGMGGVGQVDPLKLVGPKLVSFQDRVNGLLKTMERAEAGRRAGMPGAGPSAIRPGVPAPLDTAALDAQKALADKAKKIIEETKTPLEKFREGIADLNAMFKAGEINQVQYQRAFKAAADEYTAKAREVFDDTRTPLERFAIRMRELQGMLAAGQLDRGTFDRAAKKARGDILGAQEAPKLAGAVQLGSAEAYSAIARRASGRGAENDLPQIARNSQQQTTYQAQMVQLLGRLSNASQGGAQVVPI